MRRLILLRHAKSDRPAGVPDSERPLNGRGRRAAPAVGGRLAAEGLRPDLALVSAAARTRETWAALAPALGEPEMRAVAEIYEAPAERILDAVRAAPDAAGTVMVVGHNPGLGDLAAALVGDGPRKLRTRLATEFPTAAFAVIAFDAQTWAGIAPGQGRLEHYVRPRDIDPDLAG
ncbi:histidine phosphatase family protein [Methylobacterium sp. NEAU 140]|uniref:SixA phosphatase family protein n=1 Tax=Methylobacterium sp. NEAU 140 TaxID=3064945 RepID=UPI002734F69A|nr:histidine phosphatase family protein [Methylobacterium sp. NEAU 140]MDP4024764.1 histidine phosphatase family protein [Methylobacterium sp. NEAU 140]